MAEIASSDADQHSLASFSQKNARGCPESLGRVHVAAGPIVTLSEEALAVACYAVQETQRNQPAVSSCHVQSAFDLDLEAVDKIVKQLSGATWPPGLSMPVSASRQDLYALMLQ
jgi:hypothetical protein